MLRLASASLLFALIAGLSQAYGQPPEMGGCTLSAGPALSVPYAALLPPGAWEQHWETLLATQQQANGTQRPVLTHELVVLQAAAGTAGSAGTAAAQEAAVAAAGTAGLTGTAPAAGIASQDLTAGQAGTLQATAGTAAGSAAAVEQGAADGKGPGGAAGGSGGGGGGSIACGGGLLSSDWTLYLRKGSTDAAVFRQVLSGSVCRTRRGRPPAPATGRLPVLHPALRPTHPVSSAAF